MMMGKPTDQHTYLLQQVVSLAKSMVCSLKRKRRVQRNWMKKEEQASSYKVEESRIQYCNK